MVHKSPFEPAHDIYSTVTKTQVSLCKCTDSPEPSLHRKNESSNRFWGVIVWDYDTIAAAVLRHAEFPQVRQSQ